ncbi:MAG: B12-binding domain-containing radical SAM protein, partial [Thermoplasmata archaeon]
MKITLISPYYDVASIGIRILSSCLKTAGHHTRMVFLPQVRGGYLNDFLIEENEKTMNNLIELCSDSDLIGITLMTNYFFRVARLTQKLKRELSQPIIWGGIHPTIRPRECLQYADMICVGEGEISLVELCNCLEKGLDQSNIKGIWSRREGEIINNGTRSLIQDLDSVPYPDYTIDNSFILEKDYLVPMDYGRLHLSLLRGMTIDDGKATYQVITSRGCPLNCSYCSNDILKRLHGKEKYLRCRSPENVIKELEDAINKMDFIRGIWISDDCFIYQPTEYLEKYIDLYKKKVNLPFFCLGDPIHVTREKMNSLCDGGLKLMTMGLQSGSEKTKKLYKRNISNDKILETTKIINQFQAKMYPPMYDIIVDNPYESLEDQFETIKLISKIPRPYYLQLFSLSFFPETSLYKRAVKDGIITDDYKQIYNKP